MNISHKLRLKKVFFVPFNKKLIIYKIIFLLIGIALFVIDKFLKIHLYNIYIDNPNWDYNFIPNFIDFNVTVNPGIAFGWMPQFHLFTVFFPIIVCVFFAIFFVKTNSRFIAFGSMLILFGGLGNLSDRIYDGHSSLFNGQVVDYVRMFGTNYIFNLADAVTSVGFLFLFVAIIYYGFFKKEPLAKIEQKKYESS